MKLTCINIAPQGPRSETDLKSSTAVVQDLNVPVPVACISAKL